MELDSDMIDAALHLADRSGCSDVTIGYDEDVDGWFMSTTFSLGDVEVTGYASPDEAAYGFARRLLRGAACRCGKRVTVGALISPEERREESETPLYFCRWQLVGPRWVPGCDVPPVPVSAKRGDYAAIHAALEARRRGGR